jgi:5-(carboxyamino)imidazole ribonucleotide mutase
MPKGVAVGTLAIGSAGAYNAALLAIQVLALHDESIATKLDHLRHTQTDTILSSPTPGIINR